MRIEGLVKDDAGAGMCTVCSCWYVYSVLVGPLGLRVEGLGNKV